jgi:DNA primase
MWKLRGPDRDRQMNDQTHDSNRFARLRQLPLRNVAGRLGVQASARAIRCPLPDHDDLNPSFAFFFATNTWKCFGCGRGGTTIDLVIAMRRCSPGEAATWLEGAASSLPEAALPPPDGRPAPAASAHAALPDHDVYSALLALCPLRPPARDYLHTREISDATITHFHLAFLDDCEAVLDRLLKRFSRERLCRAGVIAAPHASRLSLPSSSIVLPFLRMGKVEYLQSRLMPGAAGPRWMGLTGVRKPVFNSDVLLKADTIHVCEGAMDVLSAHELKLSAIGLLGAATRLPHDMLQRLIAKTVYVVPDNDAAGADMLRRLVADIRSAGGVAREKRVPEGSDLNDYLVLKRGALRARQGNRDVHT